MKLLHLIPDLGPGGPARSLCVLAEESLRTTSGLHHSVIAVGPPTYMPVRLKLKRLGVAVLANTAPDSIDDAIRDADVVILHFWNTPVLWQLLARPLPDARYVIWAKVEGTHAPQRLAPVLLDSAQCTIFTAAPPDRLAMPSACVVPGLVETARVANVVPTAHSGLNADYLGTLSAGKLHPAFFEMMDNVSAPDLAVRYGGGALDPTFAPRLEATRHPGRFRSLGFVEDIGQVLAASDIFAYPLAPQTYASSDKALQEAMLAGVPPVILPHGGPQRFVENGVTGIVASDESHFTEAVESLCRDTAQRRVLGARAQRFARDAFQPAPHVARFMEAVRRVSSEHRSGPLLEPAQGLSPPGVFLVSQGWSPQAARGGLADWDTGRKDTLRAFGHNASDDVFRLEGGILHWRNAFPGSAVLRQWSADWLERQGRSEEAAREEEAALALDWQAHST